MSGQIQGFISDNIDVAPYDNRDDIAGMSFIISDQNAHFSNDANIFFVNSTISSYSKDDLCFHSLINLYEYIFKYFTNISL